MKRRIAIPFIFTLFSLCFSGCGSIPDDPREEKSSAARPTTELDARRILVHSEAYKENELLAAAGKLVNRGESLTSQEARQCWMREGNRIRAREACALAWSSGSETQSGIERESESLESEFLQNKSWNRGLALAFARRPGLLFRASIETLGEILVLVRNDPVWLRSRMAYTWIKGHANASQPDRSRLWNEVARSKKERSPADLAALWVLARELGPSREEELLSGYCRPRSHAYSQVRCLRFLSAIEGKGNLSFSSRAIFQLRSIEPEGWKLFEQSFPEKALQLRNYL